MIPEMLQLLRVSLINQKWVQKILKRGNIYLVGGCVRDAYLGKNIKDIDVLIEDVSIVDIKTILQGYGKVDEVGESFSVLKFKPTDNNEVYDIAIPRKDIKVSKGHKGFKIINEGVSVKKDLKRRDFTINAIAYCLRDNRVIDPFNGISDIKLRNIRAINRKAFKDDPLRILRGIQFAIRFNMQISFITSMLMARNSKLLKEISGERVLGELMKVVDNKGNFAKFLSILRKTNVDKNYFGHKISINQMIELTESYTSLIKYADGMVKETHTSRINYADEISFFYILAILTYNDPVDLYKNKLKGKNELTRKISDFCKLKREWTIDNSMTRARYFFDAPPDCSYPTHKVSGSPKLNNWKLLFDFKTKYPDIKFDKILALPEDSKDIIEDMNNKDLPSCRQELKINGNDVVSLGITGKDVGIILDRMAIDAAKNKYDWWLTRCTTEYLKRLIEKEYNLIIV